jgi:SAM-dependent methyltransferase
MRAPTGVRAVEKAENAVARVARQAVVSSALLSRRPVLMACLDAVDRAVSFPFPEFRSLPPNRLRVRAGVGNRLFFNQAHYLEYGARTVLDLQSRELLDRGSSILDVGCGCGRLAHALRRYGFEGEYVGVDVDREMVDWCAANLAGPGFGFVHADVFSSVYNPNGARSRYRFPGGDGSYGLVVGQSLLTHLLEDEVHGYLAESFRVLGPGGALYMSVFCVEDMGELGSLGGRWTFRSRIGEAFVENADLPEAAVAYSRDFLERACRRAGFDDVEVIRRAGQSLLIGRR